MPDALIEMTAASFARPDGGVALPGVTWTVREGYFPSAAQLSVVVVGWAFEDEGDRKVETHERSRRLSEGIAHARD